MTSLEALRAGSPHPSMRSVEPLLSLRGAGGVSYFTVLAAPAPETYARIDTSIWVLGLGRDPQQLIVRRVDDGGVTDKKGYRHEPETCRGPGEVLVSCTVDEAASGHSLIHHLRRCRTGITPGGQ